MIIIIFEENSSFLVMLIDLIFYTFAWSLDKTNFENTFHQANLRFHLSWFRKKRRVGVRKIF